MAELHDLFVCRRMALNVCQISILRDLHLIQQILPYFNGYQKVLHQLNIQMQSKPVAIT